VTTWTSIVVPRTPSMTKVLWDDLGRSHLVQKGRRTGSGDGEDMEDVVELRRKNERPV